MRTRTYVGGPTTENDTEARETVLGCGMWNVGYVGYVGAPRARGMLWVGPGV